MAYDLAVARVAYNTAVSMGASGKVLLSLFEAGIVETGMRNLNYGDRDSVGYLQQRPSQGWPNPMDVATATKSYVSRAIANQKKFPGYSAGRLAQSVQISAFPEKYDKVEGEAQKLLNQIAGKVVDTGSTSLTDKVDMPVIVNYTDNPLTEAAGALRGMVESVNNIGKWASQLAKLPSYGMRIAAAIVGIALVFTGLFMLGRQARS